LHHEKTFVSFHCYVSCARRLRHTRARANCCSPLGNAAHCNGGITGEYACATTESNSGIHLTIAHTESARQ
jgi:hypothetical protein